MIDELLPGGDRHNPTTQRRPYAVLHRNGHPRMLIPLHSRRAAAATLTHYPSDLPARQRLQRLAVAAGLRLGIAQAVLRPKRDAHVSLPDLSSSSADAPDLHSYLAAALGVEDVVIAFTLGPPRPNQKPIAHVFDITGRLMAVAKIGVNALTSQLVRHEASFLKNAPRGRLAHLRVPNVLHEGLWREWEVALLEPLPVPRGLRVNCAEPTAAEIREVASLGPCTYASLGAGPYLSSVRSRIARATDPAEADLIARALDDVQEAAGDLVLPHGVWHGDWTPWNMARRDGGLLVWDWERADADTPVGFDVLHYHFQVALLREQVPADALLRVTLQRSREMLTSLDVGELGHRLLLRLYVAELHLRYLDNREAGAGDHAVSRCSTVRRLLESGGP